MKHIHPIALCLLLATLTKAQAQDFSSLATSLPKMKGVFTKILSDTPNFSARAVIGLFDATNRMLAKMPMHFDLTPDRMREEIDAMNMPIPLEWREAVQKGHINEIAIITRVDTKKIYMLFPGIRAYQEFPISDSLLSEFQARANAVSIEKVELGQETIEGHPCIQTRLTVTETNKPPEFAILRCATDLQNFPIRMDLYATNSTTRFIFEDVHIGMPAATLFEIPANYMAFTNTADLMRYAKEREQNQLP
jgi:hypothetical protein